MDAHYQALQSAFPIATLVSQDKKSATISVEDNVNGYQISLLIHLGGGFPNQPPHFVLPYSNIVLPVVLSASSSPVHRSSVVEAVIRWDPTRPDLVEATQHGFRIAYLYWGKVTPPTVQMLTMALANENPRVLQELMSNPNKLDVFAYNHPMSNTMRSASQDTVQEIENLVEENTSLRHAMEQQQSRVSGLQSQLRSRLEELNSLEKNSLFASLCTPEAIKRTLRKDVVNLEVQSRQLSRDTLDTPVTNKRAFEDALEKFRENAKQIHLIQVKINEYDKQTGSQ